MQATELHRYGKAVQHGGETSGFVSHHHTQLSMFVELIAFMITGRFLILIFGLGQSCAFRLHSFGGPSVFHYRGLPAQRGSRHTWLAP